jgi:hypothetical protein
MPGKEEEGKEKTEFEKMSEEIKGAHKDVLEEEQTKNAFLAQIDSLMIMVPAIETVSLETTGSKVKELKICELPVVKHLEYEKAINQMDVDVDQDVEKLKNLKFEDILSMKMADWGQMKKVVILICDNGLNLGKGDKSIVDEQFCDDYLTWTLVSLIIMTYNKKFVVPSFIQLWTLKGFFQRVLLFSGKQNQ